MNIHEIIVETPRHSREKYEFNEKTNSYCLKKLLPAGMCFPYDFGFIPNTKGDDGDPLDAMIISEFTTFPGCRINCRLIGVVKAEQTGGKGTKMRNDRFLFVPEISDVYKNIQSADDFPESLTKDIIFFLLTYNDEEEVKVLKVTGKEKAERLLRKNSHTD